jgi:hypothetical protein
LTKYVTLCKITLSEKLLKKFMKKKLKNSFPQFINVLKGDEGLMNSDLFSGTEMMLDEDRMKTGKRKIFRRSFGRNV